jgi:hypothetical protein
VRDIRAATPSLCRARDLAQSNPHLAQIERELVATERQAALVPRLSAILTGKAKPVDTTEAIGFAQVCSEKKLHGASARFSAEAFQAQPKLADNMQAQVTVALVTGLSLGPAGAPGPPVAAAASPPRSSRPANRSGRRGNSARAAGSSGT